MKIVDLTLHIDGLILNEGESVEDYIKKIEKITNSSYDIICETLYEQEI